MSSKSNPGSRATLYMTIASIAAVTVILGVRVPLGMTLDNDSSPTEVFRGLASFLAAPAAGVCVIFICLFVREEMRNQIVKLQAANHSETEDDKAE